MFEIHDTDDRRSYQITKLGKFYWLHEITIRPDGHAMIKTVIKDTDESFVRGYVAGMENVNVRRMDTYSGEHLVGVLGGWLEGGLIVAVEDADFVLLSPIITGEDRDELPEVVVRADNWQDFLFLVYEQFVPAVAIETEEPK